MRPVHHLPEVEPTKVATALKHKLNNPNPAPSHGHPQVLGFGFETAPEQNFDEAVKVTVDGNPQRRASHILVLILGRLARPQPCLGFKQSTLAAEPTKFHGRLIRRLSLSLHREQVDQPYEITTR